MPIDFVSTYLCQSAFSAKNVTKSQEIHGSNLCTYISIAAEILYVIVENVWKECKVSYPTQISCILV